MKSMTVAELIKKHNEQKEETFHKIKVHDPHSGNYAIREFTDVSNVSEKDGILSFYGRAKPPISFDLKPPEQNEIRFTRMNDGEIIYSEV